MVKIYNTLGHKTTEFKPIKPSKVGMYSCGPTVYDFAHIGHFRTYAGTDILRRVLEYFGYEVTQVMNITDVGHLTSDADTGEDKLEKGAKREGKSVWDIARFYTDDFVTAMEKLNVKKPTKMVKATDHIAEMIALIRKLEEKGITYKTDDGIYFDTSKDPDYGKLTGQNLLEIKAGARVEMVPGKKHPTDFALWKFSPKETKRQMEWDSPWGMGFPGWHIECSAMATKYLGQPFDIHTGGIDHIPIHHTNEIAQSECAFDKPLANYWVHFNFLMVNGMKMSKSLGNIYNQHDILKKGFSLLDCRYLFLTSHYRDVLNFTWESLEAARTAYGNLRSLMANLYLSKDTRKTLSPDKLKKVDAFRQAFDSALQNDMAMPTALAVVWQVAKSNIPSGDKRDLLLDFDQVLGLKLAEAQFEKKEIKVPAEVMELVHKREELRIIKKWAEADKVREMIEEKGYIVEDTAGGSKVSKI